MVESSPASPANIGEQQVTRIGPQHHHVLVQATPHSATHQKLRPDCEWTQVRAEKTGRILPTVADCLELQC